jgi:hypothetical protein
VARLVGLGEAAGSPSAAAAELRRALRSCAGPTDLDRRAALAADLAVVARAAGDATAGAVAAHHAAMVAGWVHGDVTGRSELRALVSALGSRGAGLLAEQRLAAGVVRTAEVRAPAGVHDHDHDDDDDHDHDHGELGVPGSMVGPQLLVAAWLRRSRPHAPAAEDPDRASVALRALLEGEEGTARLEVRALCHQPDESGGGDARFHTLAMAAVVAAELSDGPAAEALGELLTPAAHLFAGAGYRSFAGPVRLHLGRLAAVRGDGGEAERQLGAAIGQLGALAATPWLAVAREDLAHVLGARRRASDLAWSDWPH